MLLSINPTQDSGTADFLLLLYLLRLLMQVYLTGLGRTGTLPYYVK